MSLKDVPAHVRRYMYLTWVGMILGALGVLGFILSFWQVGSPVQAATDLQTPTPWGAYFAILLWVVGMVITWIGRRKLDSAVRARKRELAAAATVELD